MANEYRRLDGAGVGVKRTEKELGISVANMNAAGAITLGTDAKLTVVWLATATPDEITECLEHAKRRIERYLSTK